MPSTIAIIVAAGSSKRLGFDKLAADLAGKSVLRRTLEAFDQCRGIDQVILVTAPGMESIMRSNCDNWGIRKAGPIVAGGAERHHSVARGIEACPDTADLIAVHDGGRPLISPDQIQRCIDEAAKSGAAASGRRITETVKRATIGGTVAESVDRENLWAMETPQVFKHDLLARAYRYVLENELVVTDEVSAVEMVGHPVQLVENRSPNPKITFPADLDVAARLIT